MSLALRLAEAGAVVAAYAAGCMLLALQRRRAAHRALAASDFVVPSDDAQPPVLIAFASQTGFAEQLALQTAQALQAASVPARVRPIAELAADALTGRVLFIVSTYGEGDAPDPASAFVRHVMAYAPDLAQLQFGVLALGDRGYANFCGFGRRLDAWLRMHGARALFERVELDNADPRAMQSWQSQLATLAGRDVLPAWQAPAFTPWPLSARRLLNPGSLGQPCFHLELTPPAGASWEAGDLVEILAPGDAARPREYSIASLPQDGTLQLLVRQERPAPGVLGVASGWLTESAELGTGIALQLRANRNFRIDGNEHCPLLLIGNGTGWAGLRAHLKARAAQPAAGRAPCWLLFGERQAAHDAYHADEVVAWRASGVLACSDLVFSRDGAGPRYVQDALADQRDRLLAWLADGAAVYVCGSRVGMAAGVDDALRAAVGEDALLRLTDEGRYRRDVY